MEQELLERFQQSEQARQKTERALNTLQKEVKLREMVEADPDVINAKVVSKLLLDQVRLEHGQLVGGEQALSALKVKFAEAFWSTNPEYTERMRLEGKGQQALTAQNNIAAELPTLFGRKSDGAKANRLKKENPSEYARLKIIAKEKKLI